MYGRREQAFPSPRFSLEQNGRKATGHIGLPFEQPLELVPYLYDFGMISEE
jgi:hypothetical protein